MKVDAAGYEIVDRIIKNGRCRRLGDKPRCLCTYEVAGLLPMWSFNTKEHMPDHPNNGLKFNVTKSPMCVIHDVDNILVFRN